MTLEGAPPKPRPGASDEQPERPAAEPRPFDVLAGGREALLAIVVSGLLIVGLWLIAREAPSAGTDPRLVPSAAVTPGAAPFGEQTFATAVPRPGSPPPDEAGGS